jgi:hypothetical protein
MREGDRGVKPLLQFFVETIRLCDTRLIFGYYQDLVEFRKMSYAISTL